MYRRNPPTPSVQVSRTVTLAGSTGSQVPYVPTTSDRFGAALNHGLATGAALAAFYMLPTRGKMVVLPGALAGAAFGWYSAGGGAPGF